MKSIDFFFAFCLIHGTILPTSKGLYPSFLDNLIQGIAQQPTAYSRPTQASEANNLRAGLNTYVTNNQNTAYRNPQGELYNYNRNAYPQNYGVNVNKLPADNKLYQGIGNGGTANSQNSWIDTENSDADNVGSGLGIFTPPTPTTQDFSKLFGEENIGNNNNIVQEASTTESNVLVNLPKEDGPVNPQTSFRSKVKHVNTKPKKDVLMVLIAKTEEFQAQPVIPENERKNPYKILYYKE